MVMKLLYLNKINTNAGWGFETFLNQSLEDLKVDTICLDYQENRYSLARKLLNVQEEFDALLLQRGCGYLIPLPILKAIQRPRFLVFTELVARNPEQHYLLKSGFFDHVFLRSNPCINWVRQQGWLQDSQISLFLSAINPGFHRYIPNLEKTIDVLFVGTLSPRRQEIINKISQLPITVRSAFGDEMVQLFNRAKIVLNLHGTEFLDTESRIYEALACRSFVITERLSEESPFQNLVHLIETNGSSDMIQKIRYYLANTEAREKIAYSGYLEVLKNHTVLSRAKQIKTIFEDQLLTRMSQTYYPSLNQQALGRLRLLEKGLHLRDLSWRKTRTMLSKAKRMLIHN